MSCWDLPDIRLVPLAISLLATEWIINQLWDAVQQTHDHQIRLFSNKDCLRRLIYQIFIRLRFVILKVLKPGIYILISRQTNKNRWKMQIAWLDHSFDGIYQLIFNFKSHYC